MMERLDRGAPPKKRPRTLPIQVPPKAIEAQYAKALVRYVIASMRWAYGPLLREAPKLAKARAVARHDAEQPGFAGLVVVVTNAERYDSPESRRVQKLIREAARRLHLKVNKREIARLAKKFAQQTSTFQRKQLTNQVHAALGITAPLAGEYTQSRIADFVRENVALISSIPQDLHGEVEGMVHRAVVGGQLAEDLADDLEDQFAISERRARFIARDQISKLQADFNHERQRSLGVGRFVWRSMRDERVRGTPGGLYPNAEPSHYDLDGQEFSYDDPPQPPGADGPLLPGDDYNCRCYAEPIFDDLIEDLRGGEIDEDEAAMEAE